MKKFIIAIASVLALVSCQQYRYSTVKGDPMATRIYTLDNGLKVYVTVNKETPRIQTYIAVRSGGKNDPSDNTGLAHYLEHLMFKGSENFGTQDYSLEKPMLYQIEALYEVYRTKTDPAEREALYHQIDSISYEASKIAIPNEYDKLMSVIGSSNSNAFTSNDVTCYIEDIPSNQVENWAKIESDRFKNMVIRGFHTELEAVYEEYNMYLNEDGENAMEAADAQLFKNHPYGTQTVIGTQNHLQNPSISAIKRQKASYYVPNNCAICVSGDVDPDAFVKIVDKYFGDWQPNPHIPAFEYAPEEEITSPVELTVSGTEAEFAYLAWRTPGDKSQESEIAEFASQILSNQSCGLIDLDVNQTQKTLGAGAGCYGRTDYGEFIVEGYPKAGQSLDEVRAILLEEVTKLRDGDFSDSLVAAIYNNIKLRDMQSLTRNDRRAMKFVDSFVNGTSWADEVGKMERLSSITRSDIVAWVNKYIREDNYVVVYKTVGVNEKATKKISAPKISPIETNRDKESAYLSAIRECEVAPIEPVFVDFSKDMSKFDCEGLEVLYKKNTLNDIAELSLVFDAGKLSDPALPFASDYLDYLGTEDKSAEQIALELYSLACKSSIRVGAGTTTISVSGLSENVGEALKTTLERIANAQGDEFTLEALKDNELKSREDSKCNQRACASALNTYAAFGADYVKKTTLSNKALRKLSSEELLSKMSSLLGCQHKVLYYGPASEEQVKEMLETYHPVENGLKPLERLYATAQITNESKVFLAPYEGRQFNYTQFSNRGEKFDPSAEARIDLFNNYFGGGMNTIVFQEMREARALAYSAGAYLRGPSSLEDTYTFSARIGSQNDKLIQAVEAFDSIINDMPESDKSFEIAKTSMISDMRTSRTTGAQVLHSYLRCRELGLEEPLDKVVFEELQGLTLSDLSETSRQWVKGRTYIYSILGNTKDLDMKYLKTLGPVKILTLDEIFGY